MPEEPSNNSSDDLLPDPDSWDMSEIETRAAQPQEPLLHIPKPPLPSTVGPYRILHELGRGGMGTVYLAMREDKGIRGRVAIKVISKGRDTDAALHRFKLERQVLSALQHPNIARFIDAGETDDGGAYFVMEYVEGLAIDEYCDTNSLSIRDRLDIFQKVCEAVQFAHTNLVVHRDLKPQNIIVSSDGSPKLLDFGIAKVLNPDLAPVNFATGIDQRLMTPEYAAPEQVRGEPVTTRSDVYSLGILLYELLCGQRPYNFKARIESEIVRIISEQLPERPSTVLEKLRKLDASQTIHHLADSRDTKPDSLVKQISGELDDIVMQAMHKTQNKRYSSANDLNNDIQRYLSGEPVLARKPANRTIYRMRKYYQRHRVTVIGACAASLLLMATGAASLVQWRNTQVALLSEARSSRYAEIIWESLLDSEADIRLPVDKRHELYSNILASFDEEDQLTSTPTDTTLIRRAGVLMKLADTEFSRRGSSAKNNNDSLVLLNRAHQDLNAVDDTDSAEYSRLNINLLRRLADIHKEIRNTAEAISLYNQLIVSTNQYSKSLTGENGDVLTARILNSARRNLSSLYIQECRIEKATDELLNVATMADRLRKTYPENNKVTRDWTVAKLGLAGHQLERGNLQEAAILVSQAVPVRHSFYTDDPGNPRFQRDLATALLVKSDVQRAMGEQYRASESLEESARLLREGMVATNQTDDRMRETLSIVLFELGSVTLSLGNLTEASSILNELKTITNNLRNGSPGFGEIIEARSYPNRLSALIAIHTNNTANWKLAFDKVSNILAEDGGSISVAIIKADWSAEQLEAMKNFESFPSDQVVKVGTEAIASLISNGKSCLVPESTRHTIESHQLP